MLCRLFASHGYAAHHCSHGRDALQVMQDFRPSLLILDVTMPDVSGLDVLQAVRIDPDLAAIPVLMHSGSASDGHRKRAEALGISGYVPKGGETAARLLETVRAVLGPASAAFGPALASVVGH